ncbi:Josephin-domain-containing protein [Microstroma glucosiphilum]|uniref:ubiquitinyl hydrolase 1 n=1 Tax=Pseudomicrostroma glucosiphilum TaxID=1684307 RepID=A0A316U4A6_9BASI|nr:Josephin-domain-containing protein [Pseudomicrostroma glucosiphilum]PWN20077.1 Josephin-domain-containing protein [Pseudomicrostroma glucosiphilum]
MTSAARERVKKAILHERQEEGSMLCAQHALNNLLQGNYFDAAQLAEIASQLDGLERENLNMSDSEWGERDAAGRNADETGFFSVGVIETALQVWGLSLLRWNSADMRQFHNAPEQQLAFILNLQSHWFCFRSFGWADNLWFNLNSFLKEPTWVGTGYLGALLDQSQTEGYSVFVVRPTSADTQQAHNIVSQIRSCSADVAASSAESYASDSDEDEELKKALAASLASPEAESSTHGASSSGTLNPSTSKSMPRRRSKRQGDDDLQEALTASMRATSSRADAGRPSRLGEASGSGSRIIRSGITRDTAIDLEERSVDEDLIAGLESARSPFLHPSLRDHVGPGDAIEDEVEELHALDGSANGRAARPNPSMPLTRPQPHGNVIEISSDDEDIDADFEEQDSLAWKAATAAFQDLRDRDYDDEDAELQRALAASIAAGPSSASSTSIAQQGRQSSPDLSGGVSAEEQAEIMAAIAAARGQRSPTPADVGRIARMREEAKRKEREAREREERRERGVYTPEPESVRKMMASANQGQGTEGADEDEEDEDEDEDRDSKQMSAEELRKMRLARFGK